MRTCLLLLALATLPLRADEEAAKKLAEQEAAVLKSWAVLDLGPMAKHTTEHLRVVAPADLEPKLKAVAVAVERYREQAAKQLKLDDKERPTGKITVYVLPATLNVQSFARLVDKRRPESGEVGSFSAEDARLHVAVAADKGAAGERAGELVASLLLTRKAGLKTPVPDWLVTGFGRATTYKLSPKDKATLTEKKLVRGLLKKRSAMDVWDGTLVGEEVAPMRAALAEFFAYGPGAARFSKFLGGYRPSEGNETPTTAHALDAIGVTAASIDKTFKGWAAK